MEVIITASVLESSSSLGVEDRVTPWTLLLLGHIKTNIHQHTLMVNLEMHIELWGEARVPGENPRRHRKAPNLLWGDSDNHCTTMAPDKQII